MTRLHGACLLILAVGASWHSEVRARTYTDTTVIGLSEKLDRLHDLLDKAITMMDKRTGSPLDESRLEQKIDQLLVEVRRLPKAVQQTNTVEVNVPDQSDMSRAVRDRANYRLSMRP